MQIKSIIFDLDGLLINSEIVSFEIYKELLAQHQHNFTLENYAQNYSGRSSILNMENIIKEYRLPFSIQEGITHSDRIEEKYVEEGIALMNGARELLDYLKEKQYEISLASSSTRERAFTILKQNEIFDYFSHFTFGPEIENGKPAPDIFLIACKKTGFQKHETLILEDSQSGIQAALAADIPVICVPDMKEPHEDFLSKTEEVLSSLHAVIEWLEIQNSLSK